IRKQSLVKDKDEFFEEENKELNTLLRGVSPDDVPDDFKQELIDLIDMMLLTENVLTVNKKHVDFLYSELSDEVTNDH
ncbi:hypothetical protein AB4559_23450, partial [Vibrio sp. 10N.222.51.C8]|uniref:hypothetical protein n=1 Tax=Vibrio sp. 10N.222.51.C8 TaxID=3229624 RepID=UPI00354BA0BA